MSDATGNAETIAVAGVRNAERLDPLRRIDLRATKQFDPKVGTVRFFAELTNATNRDNPCCLAFDPVTSANGSLVLERSERNSLPMIVNVGLLWEF